MDYCPGVLPYSLGGRVPLGLRKSYISKKWCRLGGLGQRIRPFGESLSHPQIMFVVGIIYSQVYLPKTIHKPSVK